MIIVQIFQALFAGMKIGVQLVFASISMYIELSKLQTNILAMVLGVSPIVITIASFCIKFLKNRI